MTQHTAAAEDETEERHPRGSSDLPSRRTRQRQIYIDACRGTLILLMVSSHAITLSGLSYDHWLIKYGLPRGWATVAFVSLSGYVIGLLFRPDAKSAKKLRRRSWQLLLIMFVSNLMFLILRYLAQDFTVLQNPEWWIGLVTLETEYTISSVLIPTSILVLISPALLQFVDRYSAFHMFFAAFAAAISTALIRVDLRMSDINFISGLLLHGGNGFFPILPFVLFGIVCLGLGAMSRRHATSIVVVLVVSYFAVGHVGGPGAQVYRSAVAGPVLMFVVLAVAALAGKWFPRIAEPMALIGKFALFSFVSHRVFLHAMLFALPSFHLDDAFEYIILSGSTMVLIWLGCKARIRFPRFDELLKRVWL